MSEQKKSNNLIILGAFTVLASVVACNFQDVKKKDGNPPSLLKAGVTPGYNTVKRLVFEAKCLPCHTGDGGPSGINLYSYATAFPAASRIKNEVSTEKSMPPSGPVDTALQKIVSDWVDAGAPENDIDENGNPAPSPSPVVTPSPSPPPSSSVVSVSFESVKAQLFQPHCLDCHSGAQPSGGINLETYASVKLVIDRVKNEVITEKSMPPTGPVDASLQTLLQSWIDAGLPEHPGDIVVPPSPVPSPSPSPSPSLGAVSFDLVKAQLFQPHCLGCHSGAHPSGDVNLETYTSVTNVIDRVKNEVITEKSMPPTGPVDESLQSLLQSWIDAGLPEHAGGVIVSPSPSPRPIPSPSPSVTRVTYAMVRDQIFSRSCVQCHGTRGGITLETYAQVKQNLSKVKKEVITQQAMPPSMPLGADLRTLLANWIAQGAPEN